MADTPEPPNAAAAHPQASPGTPEAVERSKKLMMNGRVEIDTSPPFGSVKEAVTHFEGRAFWIPPLHMLYHHPRNAYTVSGNSTVEEQAAELEKDLTIKEQETLNVLRELEMAKRIVEELKSKLQMDISTPGLAPNDRTSVPSIAHTDFCPENNVTRRGISIEGSNPSTTPTSPNFILMELQQAKSNLSRTTNDLAVIRASVESLNEKVLKEKISIEKTQERLLASNTRKVSLEAVNEAQMQGSSTNLTNVSQELKQLNFAAEQFIKMAEASKCEVLTAMSEIENMKKSMKTAEMRWAAAKKMEEAARAVEAVALAEMKCLSNYENLNFSSATIPIQNPVDKITLSLEEYSYLAQKARKADGMDETNASKLAMLKELGKATQEVEFSKRALEEALNRVEVANTAKLHARETLHQQWTSNHGQSHRTRPTQNPFPSSHRQDARLLFDVNRSNLINHETKPVLRPSISLKDILGRKQILPEDFVVGSQPQGPTDRPKVPLSEMLRLHRGVLSASNAEDEKHGVDHRQLFAQRKKFGFIHISLPLTKQGRKKMQASNTRSHNG